MAKRNSRKIILRIIFTYIPLFAVLAITIFLFVENLFLSDTTHILTRRIILPTLRPTPTPVQSIIPTDTPFPIPTFVPITIIPTDSTPWGIAHQVNEHTWTIKVGQDTTMATPQDIFAALNNYRNKKKANSLEWDNGLAQYAQSRAELFDKNGNTDEHAGFEEYLDKEDGFNKLGFHGLGENSSIGYQLLGVHLIEWIYASDPGHDSNQLSSQWSSVGIGVSGTATDLIFGGSKF